METGPRSGHDEARPAKREDQSMSSPRSSSSRPKAKTRQELEKQVQMLAQMVEEMSMEQRQLEAERDQLIHGVNSLQIQQQSQPPQPAGQLPDVRPPGTVAVSDECAALYAEGYRLIHGQASPLAKAAACKYIDTEFLIKCWLDSRAAQATLLRMGADVPDSPAEEHLGKIVRIFMKCFPRFWKEHPREFEKFHMQLAIRMGATGPPPADTAQKVLDAVQMTEHQKTALLRVYADQEAQLAELMKPPAPAPASQPSEPEAHASTAPPALSDRSMRATLAECLGSDGWM